MADWNDEETANSFYADDRNFYKLEKWTKAHTKMDFASRSSAARRRDGFHVASRRDL
jgi:hypothetical protein